jgi:hypothetical protein
MVISVILVALNALLIMSSDMPKIRLVIFEPWYILQEPHTSILATYVKGLSPSMMLKEIEAISEPQLHRLGS